MSIEAIKQVTQAEASAQEKKTNASVQAKQLVRDAESGGLALLEETRKKAELAAREAMARAEQNAAARTQQVLAVNQGVCDELCRGAEARLDAAATLIIKRIVNV